MSFDKNVIFKCNNNVYYIEDGELYQRVMFSTFEFDVPHLDTIPIKYHYKYLKFYFGVLYECGNKCILVDGNGLYGVIIISDVFIKDNTLINLALL